MAEPIAFDPKEIERIVTIARQSKLMSVAQTFTMASFLARFPQFKRVDFTNPKYRIFVLSKCSTGAEFQPFLFIPDTEVQQLIWRLKVQVLFFADAWGETVNAIFDLSLNARGYLDLREAHRFALAGLANASMNNKKLKELQESEQGK